MKIDSDFPEDTGVTVFTPATPFFFWGGQSHIGTKKVGKKRSISLLPSLAYNSERFKFMTIFRISRRSYERLDVDYILFRTSAVFVDCNLW